MVKINPSIIQEATMNHIFHKGLHAALAMALGCVLTGATASELGSPAETRRAMSNDIHQLVEQAYPKYDAPMLKMKLENTAKKYPRGLDALKIQKLSDVEKQLKLKSQRHASDAKMFKAAGVSYEVDPAIGKIRFQQEVLKPMAVSRAKGNQLLPTITKRHDALIAKIGVTPDQTFFKKTSLLMSQGSGNPKNGATAKTEPVVIGATTHVIRAIDGIIVEGSGAKVTSFTSDKVNAVHVNWPRVQFHPGIRSYELKSQDSIKRAIAERVKMYSGNEKANVKMAVVLLPVMENGAPYMVPVMKVAVRTETGGTGSIFYENVLAEEVPIEKPRGDEASGSAQ